VVQLLNVRAWRVATNCGDSTEPVNVASLQQHRPVVAMHLIDEAVLTEASIHRNQLAVEIHTRVGTQLRRVDVDEPSRRTRQTGSNSEDIE